MPDITINNKKGVALFIVLATIFIVVLLGNIIVRIILSQSRLTTHQINRIQAYYAAMAGINLAYERLRSGNDPSWPIPAAKTCYTKSLVDSTFPISIRKIDITVADAGIVCPPLVQPCTPPSGISICISATVDYSYTP